jgi:hypothetical protein
MMVAGNSLYDRAECFYGRMGCPARGVPFHGERLYGIVRGDFGNLLNDLIALPGIVYASAAHKQLKIRNVVAQAYSTQNSGARYALHMGKRFDVKPNRASPPYDHKIVLYGLDFFYGACLVV